MQIIHTALTLMAIFFTTTIFAQLDPVSWSFEAKKISDTEYDLVLTAKVDDGWFIYSQYLESDFGPIPTSFTLEPHAAYELVGKTEEKGHKKEGYDEIFEMNLVKFDGEVQFIQRINIKGEVSQVKGSLEFMTCDDERCLPPKMVDFAIPLE